jgi:hypothetical protein
MLRVFLFYLAVLPAKIGEPHFAAIPSPSVVRGVPIIPYTSWATVSRRIAFT